MPTPPPLVLASSSPYRATMLERLAVPFTTDASGIDETRREGESPDELVRRLARQKAERVAERHPGAAVLGADQVAVLGEDVLGKPGDRERAVAQLGRMAGRTVTYLSGIALLHEGECRLDVVPTRLEFRDLSGAEIERYVDREKPFDCAGAMRSEAQGIALLDSLSSDDSTALIGLPLIRIADWLRSLGYAVP